MRLPLPSSVSFSTLVRGAFIPVLLLALSLVVARGASATDAARPVAASAPVGIPVAISGTVLGLTDGGLAILETGAAAPVAFPVVDAERLTVTRGGDSVTVGDLRQGDAVSMAIDGRTGRVLRVDAQAPASGRFAPSNEAGLLAALGLVAGAGLLTVRLRRARTLTPGARRPLDVAAAPSITVPGSASLIQVLRAPRPSTRAARG